MESVLEEAIRKKKKLRLVGTERKTSARKKAQSVAPAGKANEPEESGGKSQGLFEDGLEIDEKKLVRYLLSTVHEVIEVSRRPVPVLDKSGQPTGTCEYQSATVLKACELMAKLMGTIKEDDSKGVSVQIVSYRDAAEENKEEKG